MKRAKVKEIPSRLHSGFKKVFRNVEMQISPSMTSEDVKEWANMTNTRPILEVEREFNIRISALKHRVGKCFFGCFCDHS